MPPKGRSGAAALGAFFKGVVANLGLKIAGDNLEPVFKTVGTFFAGPFFRDKGPPPKVRPARGNTPPIFTPFTGIFFWITGPSTTLSNLKGFFGFLGFHLGLDKYLRCTLSQHNGPTRKGLGGRNTLPDTGKVMVQKANKPFGNLMGNLMGTIGGKGDLLTKR